MGSHVAHEEEFEVRRPVKTKDSSFHRKAVDVKCEIYEPQVHDSPAAPRPTAGPDTFIIRVLRFKWDKQSRVSKNSSYPFCPLQTAIAEKLIHANADVGHAELQHHNHTHLHPHEHAHAATPNPEGAVSTPRGPLGTVVNHPASPRSSPLARSCPGPPRHRLGIYRLRL